jgi:hypothetical protein
MNPDELVQLSEFSDATQARFAIAALADKGIEAKFHGDEHSALGIDLDGPEPIEVIVKRKDYEAAKAILKDLSDAESDPVPAWTCKCGAEVDEGFAVCWSCQAEYEPKK